MNKTPNKIRTEIHREAILMERRNGEVRYIDLMPKALPIPSGCEEYLWDKHGNWVGEAGENVVYRCVASNYKNAKRKYDNWLKNAS